MSPLRVLLEVVLMVLLVELLKVVLMVLLTKLLEVLVIIKRLPDYAGNMKTCNPKF